jgi:hypothetical protein
MQQVAVGEEGGRGARRQHLQHLDIARDDIADGLAADDGHHRHDHQADEDQAADDRHQARQRQQEVAAGTEAVLQGVGRCRLGFLHAGLQLNTRSI